MLKMPPSFFRARRAECALSRDTPAGDLSRHLTFIGANVENLARRDVSRHQVAIFGYRSSGSNIAHFRDRFGSRVSCGFHRTHTRPPSPRTSRSLTAACPPPAPPSGAPESLASRVKRASLKIRAGRAPGTPRRHRQSTLIDRDRPIQPLPRRLGTMNFHRYQIFSDRPAARRSHPELGSGSPGIIFLYFAGDFPRPYLFIRGVRRLPIVAPANAVRLYNVPPKHH